MLQHRRSHRVRQVHERQQQVLCADLVIAAPLGLVDGKLYHLFGLLAKLEAGRSTVTRAHQMLNGIAQLPDGQAQFREDASRLAILLTHEAQKQVLGADVTMIQPTSFFLSHAQGLSRAPAEPVESVRHDTPCATYVYVTRISCLYTGYALPGLLFPAIQPIDIYPTCIIHHVGPFRGGMR